jgi:hypothetical protein
MKELLFAIAVGQTFLSDLSDNKGTDRTSVLPNSFQVGFLAQGIAVRGLYVEKS